MEKKLHAWASELGYKPTGKDAHHSVPSEEDFRSLCRGDGMRSIWAHLMKVIRPLEFVEYVKGNLELQELMKHANNPTVEDLRWRCLEGRAQHSQLTNKVQAIENEIQTLTDEISRMENEKRGMKEKALDNAQRKIFYESMEKEVHLKAERMRTATRKLSETLKPAKRSPLDQREKSRAKDALAYKNSIERHCEDFAIKLCAANSPEFEPNIKAQSSDVSPRGDVSNTLLPLDQCLRNPESYLKALTSITQKKSECLREMTQAVDVQGEISKLGLNADDQIKEADRSMKSALQTLSSIVERRRRNHVIRFVETEEARNELSKLNQEEIIDEGDTSRNLDHVKAENAGLKAQLRYLKEKEQLLLEEKKHLSVSKRAADEMHKSMKMFARRRRIHFDQIRQFIDARKSIEEKLIDLKTEMEGICTEKINPKLCRIIELRGLMNGFFQNEIDSFEQMELNSSTYRLVNWRDEILMPLAAAGCHVQRFELIPEPLRPLLQELGFTSWSSPCRLASHVNEILESFKDQKDIANIMLAQLEQMQEENQERLNRFSEALLKKCAQVPGFYCEQVKVLKTGVSSINQTNESKVPSALRNLNHYLEQPAQHRVPWKTVAGKNLEEWLVCMTAATMRLQELLKTNAKHQ
eukprot:CAMPEP_0114506056 /NCGR_PEP_ID=MMETSP0109-20121206/11207_1 /TAXON_ID=29199 /ORGANISM="Chlorarachnion reptans, Strain CCCM449" /LENGTH=638 /DNA_ID=CAMNT_0001684585 /DNA_START=33 /DNA_END=1949 /DNA_ORIENTATION=-